MKAQRSIALDDPLDGEGAIIVEHGPAIADALGRGCFLADLGGGRRGNGERLLDALLAPAAYVVVDSDRARLQDAAHAIARRRPHLDVLPVALEISPKLTLPRCARPIGRTVIYFPEARLAKRDPEQAKALLARMAMLAGRVGALLIGLAPEDRVAFSALNHDVSGHQIFDEEAAWGSPSEYALVLLRPC